MQITLIISAILILNANINAIMGNDALSIEKLWKEKLSNKTYIRDVYDCTDFSYEFGEILEARGIESKGVYGKYYFNDDKTNFWIHRWIEIEGRPFEPTPGYPWSGEFIPDDIYNEKYKIIRYTRVRW